MQGFRNLIVWQKAHQLTLAVYQATATFPREELYALSSQLRRAVSSIGANIAEGCGRGSDADFTRFLYMAMGSASELENHLFVARDLRFISEDGFERLESKTIEVKRMLATLIGKTKSGTR